MVTTKKQKKDTRPSSKKQALPGAKRGHNVFWLDPEDIVLVTDPAHPSRLYDARVERPVDADLKRRILRAGKVRTPIKVTKDHSATGAPLVVVGRGRVKALREINDERRAAGEEPWLIPCEVEKGAQKDLIECAVDENDGRTGDNEIERAIKMANYVDLAGEQEAADFYDCSVATVKQTIKLLTLEREVQDAVAAGVLPRTTALGLVGKTREEQLAAITVDENAQREEKIVRPVQSKITAVYGQVSTWAKDNELANTLLAWVLGKVSDKTLAKRFPHLATDVMPKDKKTAKAAKQKVEAAP